MKHPQSTVIILTLASVFASTSRAAEAAGDKIGGKPSETVIELSPFTVSASTDRGYQATSTLAGSRLNTPLRDVGAPVSVLTKDFFTDMGATDAASVLAFTASMEVTGVQGNFAGGGLTGGAQFFDITAERTTPQSSGQRVRGLARASITRGFFLTDIPFDSFNTDRVTISRGPNALLFGIGEVGGIIDNSVKPAETFGNSGEATVRFGLRGSHRENLDFNFALVPNRVALRIAGLREATEFQQRPAFEQADRLYLALKAVLFENKKSGILGPLTLKANGEYGRTVANPPNVVPPLDGVTPWFSAPSYSASEIRALNDGALPARIAWAGNGGYVPKLTVDNRTGLFTEANIPNAGLTPWFFQLPVTYNSPGAQRASVGLPDASIAGVIGRVQWQLLNPASPPNTRQVDFLGVAPLEYLGLLPGYTSPVVQNRAMLDNTKLMVAGDGSRVRESFDAKNVSLDQVLAGGRGGIQFAYDRQRYENKSQLVHANTNSNMLIVDINSYLPDLQPNPNVGRAYIMSQGNGDDMAERIRTTRREAAQATAFYRFDFTEKSGVARWLGRHTLTGFWGTQEIDRSFLFSNPVWTDVPGATTNIAGALAGPLLNGPRMKVMQVNYLTSSLQNLTAANQVRITDYVTNPIPRNGDRYRQVYSHFGAPRRNPQNGTPTFTDEFQVYYALNDGDRTVQKIESKVASWQGEFWRGNLIAMLGARRDISRTYSSPGVARLANGEWDIRNMDIDYAAPSTNSGNTVTKSLVLHVPKAWTKALPVNVSAHFSESGNFTADLARNDIKRNPLGNPVGRTRDYGITLELRDRALSLRLNRFETSSDAVSSGLGGGGLAGGAITTMLERTFENSRTLTIQQYLGAPGQPPGAVARFASYQQLYDTILNLSLAKSHGNRYNTVDGANGQPFGASLNPVQRPTITNSYTAKGYEAELVGRLTPSWNVSLNYSQQETVQSDTAVLAAAVARLHRQEIAASGLNGLLDSVTRNEPFTYESRFVAGTFNALTAVLARDGAIAAEQRKHRVNLVSNYRFTEGRLRGFQFGGSLRWQSKAAVGYRSLSTTAGVVVPDLQNAYFDDPLFNGDVMIGYERKLGNRIGWKVQLNVLNLIGSKKYIPVLINPDGRVAVVRNPNPVDVFLSNTFTF